VAEREALVARAVPELSMQSRQAGPQAQVAVAAVVLALPERAVLLARAAQPVCMAVAVAVLAALAKLAQMLVQALRAQSSSPTPPLPMSASLAMQGRAA
jgi:hypothetical protein